MKILYISNWKELSGWGEASRGLILALDSVGVDVVPRAINMGGTSAKLPARLIELEKKSQSGCDVVIQHVLPPMFQYDGRYKKNIIYFEYETSKLNKAWVSYINLADEVWVVNAQMKDCALSSGVIKPIQVVPHAFDMVKYAQNYSEVPQLKGVFNKEEFYFLTVNTFERRKNYADLLKAYFTEFQPWEPVNLVIKTNKSGMSNENLHSYVGQFVEEIKRGLKLRSSEKYRRPIVLTGQMTDDELMGLYRASDCFICPSYGEAWSIPAYEAMAMGKAPIVTNCTGFKEYVTNETGWLVDCHEEDCFGGVDNLPEIYSANEKWWSVDITKLRKCMREAYEDQDLLKQKGLAGINKSYEFSYQRVGSLAKEYLNGPSQTKMARN